MRTTLPLRQLRDAPRYHNRFGGLWVDRIDAEAVLERKRRTGRINDAEAAQLASFMRQGCVTIENAVAPDQIDRLVADIDDAWTGRNPEIHVEYWLDHVRRVEPVRPEMRAYQTKMLDLHAFYRSAREVIFARKIVEFLALLFEQAPLAFQSLCFRTGSGQPIHQDSVFSVVSAPLEFAATWIALEDVQPNSGELEYYEGSHRLEDYLFEGRLKHMPPDPDHFQKYLASLQERVQQRGLRHVRFRPKKGDALIFHADLVHGGSPKGPNSTRRSIVTLYCPRQREPEYFARAHSKKIRFGAGRYYAYPLRLGAPERRSWARALVRRLRRKRPTPR